MHTDLYYLIKEDGSAVFFQPYPMEFLVHCLCILLCRDIDVSKFSLLSLPYYLSPVPFPLSAV